MIKVSTVLAGSFKLDGGAMFGVVPKSLWYKAYPCDEQNMCEWAMRSLLIETGHRKILVDTGIGNKQDEKWRSRVYPKGPIISEALASNLIECDEITDVIITHLHFDHVGGALIYNDGNNIVPTFKNATYWLSDQHYHWACNPNPREKASFLPLNFEQLIKQDLVKWIQTEQSDVEFLPGITLRFLFGHTEAMMMPIIKTPSSSIIYCTDLMPSHAHLGLPYIIAYDVRPLITIEEKDRMQQEAIETNAIIVLEHDNRVEAIQIQDIEGKTSIKKAGTLQELMYEVL